MITVDGDSIEPLLSSGDRILIDVSRQVPVPPGIFVIWGQHPQGGRRGRCPLIAIERALRALATARTPVTTLEFLTHGTGSGRAAADHLLGARAGHSQGTLYRLRR